MAPDDSIRPMKTPKKGRPKPFPILALPAELRLRIYELLFKLPAASGAIDLDSNNRIRLAPLFLPLFLTSRQLHAEASESFYGSNTFRLFPTNGRFFKSKRPLLARLPVRHRAQLTAVELRLGPGWMNPPTGWAVNPALGLVDANKLRRLHVFVECDPASSDVFRGYRKSDDFYTDFCVALLRDVLYSGESIEEIEFDAYPSVRRDSPLMVALLQVVEAAGMRVGWGPQFREQEQKDEMELVISRISSLASLSDTLASVQIGGGASGSAENGFGVHASLQVLSEA